MIDKLADDFTHIGHSRQWYREFELLTVDVMAENSNRDNDPGTNESTIWLLQSDFHYTMNGKLPLYQRFQHLKAYCVAHDLAELLRQISYFSDNLIKWDIERIDVADYERHVRLFVNSLEADIRTSIDTDAADADAELEAIDEIEKLRASEEEAVASSPDSVVTPFFSRRR
jgi:hypothetical protein